MKRDEYLRLIAGAFVLIAVILGATVHPSWNYFAAFACLIGAVYFIFQK